MSKNKKVVVKEHKQLSWTTAVKNYQNDASIESIRSLISAAKCTTDLPKEITASASQMKLLLKDYDAIETQLDIHRATLKLAKIDVKNADEKIPQLKNRLLMAQTRLGKPRLFQKWFPSTRLKSKQLEVNKCDRALREARVEFNNTNWRINNIGKVTEKLVKQKENLVRCLHELADTICKEPSELSELADDISMGSIVIS